MNIRLKQIHYSVFIIINLLTFGYNQAQSQIINTFAGNGTSSYSGDGGPCNISGLNYPFTACVDDSGNVYIADCSNYSIRKVNAITGIIITVAGTGSKGYTGDGGLATNAMIGAPQGIAVDKDGNIYIPDLNNNVVREVTKSTGIINTIAGNGSSGYAGDGQSALNAEFATIIGVAVDDSENVYIVDHYNARIRKITKATGIIQTIAGGGSNAGSDGVGDNGPGLGASFNQPDGIAVDDSGNIYVADQWNNRIRKILAKSDSIICVAGNGSSGYSGDGGPAIAGELDVCSGVAVDESGNIYIADTYNNAIRKVTKSTGIITTLAGNGTAGFDGDGGPAINAELNQPYGVTVDQCENVYSVESSSGGQIDNRVRIIYIPDSVKVNPSPAFVCNGNSATLTATGANTYTWQPSVGLSGSVGAIVNASPSVTTTYTLTGNIGCGAGLTVVPATVVVTVGSGSALTILPASASFCSGKSVTLTTSGNNITWNPVTGLNKTAGDTVIASPIVTTTYTATELGGNCPSMGQVIITIAGSDTAGTVMAVRDTICAETPGNLSLSGNSSNTLQWQSSLNDTTFANALNDTLVNYKTVPLTQTTWYRAIVGTGSCSAISDTLQLYVPPALTASFYYIQMGSYQLKFNSDSSIGNIRSYHWDFGDGQTSNDSNPSHTYSKDSTYYVCLTLYDGSNCSYTFCRYSSITDAIAAIPASGSCVVYPDPFTNQLTISVVKNNKPIQSIEVYDVLGRVIINKNIVNLTSALHLDVSLLSTGIYFVMIKTTDGDYVHKVVKK